MGLYVFIMNPVTKIALSLMLHTSPNLRPTAALEAHTFLAASYKMANIFSSTTQSKSAPVSANSLLPRLQKQNLAHCSTTYKKVKSALSSQRTWTHPTTNLSPLQQQHSSRHHKWRSKTVLTSHGNAFFPCHWPSQSRKPQCNMASRPRKLSWLLHQTFWC